MSVKVREYVKRGKRGWEVDIVLRRADGEWIRERVKAPVNSKSAAKVWGEQRALHLLQHGRTVHIEKEPVPTLKEFAPRYIEEQVKANRQKPSTVAQKEQILKHYLLPRFGTLRLDEITNVHVQKLKAAMANKSPKTVNNVLVVLSTMLKTAFSWGLIERLPASIQLLRTVPSTVSFYDLHEFERLVAAAEKIDHQHLVFVLLGGEAGLRRGEILALEGTDVDFDRGILHVRRSDWDGHVTMPKGGRARQVNLTDRLKNALWKNQHLNGERVLWRDDRFEKVTGVLLAKWMCRIQRRAGLKVTGGTHILRHTFCSRLAMLGAPAKAIQELAGHQNLSTTQRYMHLSPAAKSAAIALLDAGRTGDILETGTVSSTSLRKTQ